MCTFELCNSDTEYTLPPPAWTAGVLIVCFLPSASAVLYACLGGEVEGEDKYTLLWALEFDVHLPQVAMVSRLRNTIMNIDKQVDVADLITCQRSIAVLLLQYKLSLSNTFFYK